MSMIFPGMDPYLEDASFWPGVHTAFIVYLRDRLQPLLRPRYFAGIEERVYLEGPQRQVIPDLSMRHDRPNGGTLPPSAQADVAVLVEIAPLDIHEAYIAIRDRQSGKQVVTVIELVSPTNKYAGAGRQSYVTKQQEVLGSQTHLVEIDLLRGGPHVLAVPEWAARKTGPYEYLISVNRAQGLRNHFELYPRKLPERLPRMRIPLAGDDADAVVDLQVILEQVYEAGIYREQIDYAAPCKPLLSSADQAWANQLIQAARQQEQPPAQ
jgi:hypothetical protein